MGDARPDYTPLQVMNSESLSDDGDELDAFIPANAALEPTRASNRHLVWGARIALTVVALFVAYYAYRVTSVDPTRYPDSPLAFDAREVSTIVEAKGTRYRGVVLNSTQEAGDQFIAFRNIKYGEIPRRFRRSKPVAETDLNSSAIVDASEYHMGCPRKTSASHEEFTYTGEEDCLRLNVYTPRMRGSKELFPVVVWIHGGSLLSGSPSEQRYTPVNIMSRALEMNRPVVFVSISYRLGTLGFTSSPPEPPAPPLPAHIPVAAPTEIDLNVGFKDQIIALEWVQSEIDKFGGNRDRVTLMGHSAGAISVGLHLLYSSHSLFHSAFMLSGGPTTFPVPWPHDATGRNLHPLVPVAGCPSPVERPGLTIPSNAKLLDCLEKKSLDEIMLISDVLLRDAGVNGNFPYYPVLEGDYEGAWINFRPSEKVKQNRWNKVPVIMGGVMDEGTRFASEDVRERSDIEAFLARDFPFAYGAIEKLLTPLFRLYKNDTVSGSPYHTGTQTFGLDPNYKRAASLIGDIFFEAPRRFFLRETTKDFGIPSWNYRYTDRENHGYFLSNSNYSNADAQHSDRLGTTHADDIYAWLGHPRADSAELRSLSYLMTTYLINFVNFRDPNGPGIPKWPHYGHRRRTLELNRFNVTVSHDFERTNALEFLNRNNPVFMR